MGDWQLESATVHVTLEGYTEVEVSGVGRFKTCDTFHVPPDANINYGLLHDGIAGPWLTRKFDAGYTDWVLS
jgi:hypothetical protein